MSLHRWLATVFVILGLAGCSQPVAGPGQGPLVSPSPHNTKMSVIGVWAAAFSEQKLPSFGQSHAARVLDRTMQHFIHRSAV